MLQNYETTFLLWKVKDDLLQGSFDRNGTSERCKIFCDYYCKEDSHILLKEKSEKSRQFKMSSVLMVRHWIGHTTE